MAAAARSDLLSYVCLGRPTSTGLPRRKRGSEGGTPIKSFTNFPSTCPSTGIFKAQLCAKLITNTNMSLSSEASRKLALTRPLVFLTLRRPAE